MTSPLPPKRRDTRDSADLIRQLKQNARQLGGGFVGGRFAPAKPLGATAQMGDLEDDGEDETIGFLNTDRTIAAGSGTVTFPLTYEPIDGSEHVSWHPAGCGGIHIPASGWVRNGQTITIPAFSGLAVGDVFTCEYAYLLGQEPEPIDPTVAATAPGTYDSGAHTLTVAMPPGTVAGALLALVVRGGTSVSGGEGTTALSVADSRMNPVFTALIGPIAGVWTGVADGSGSPIVVTITEPAGNFGAVGVLAAINGANGFGVLASVEASSVTPQVAGVAAVAMTWNHYVFATNNLAAPSGYTDVASSGINYAVADLGFWHDPDGTISPAGTTPGEGTVVIGLV